MDNLLTTQRLHQNIRQSLISPIELRYTLAPELHTSTSCGCSYVDWLAAAACQSLTSFSCLSFAVLVPACSLLLFLSYTQASQSRKQHSTMPLNAFQHRAKLSSPLTCQPQPLQNLKPNKFWDFRHQCLEGSFEKPKHITISKVTLQKHVTIWIPNNFGWTTSIGWTIPVFINIKVPALIATSIWTPRSSDAPCTYEVTCFQHNRNVCRSQVWMRIWWTSWAATSKRCWRSESSIHSA